MPGRGKSGTSRMSSLRFSTYPLLHPCGSPPVFDHKGRPSLVDRFLGLDDAGYAGTAWSFGEQASEFLERVEVSDGVHLHAAVPAVLHVPYDTQLVGPTLGE